MPLRCTRLIKQKTGLSMKDFCEQHLSTEYKSFQWRMREDKLYPAEVAYICWYLGVSCDEAFGRAYSKLVMFQGKAEIPAKAEALWNQADGTERIRLLGLLGLDLQFLIPKLPPKPAPGPNTASKVKRKPKPITQPVLQSSQVVNSVLEAEKPVVDRLDFFKDVESGAPVQSPSPKESAAEQPKSKPTDELFIETY